VTDRPPDFASSIIKEKTMKTTIAAIITFTLTLLCGTALAQAPTITFKIPVQLTSLHQDVSGVDVACTVCRPGGHVVGTSNTSIRNIPADGNVNQTVTLVVTQSSGEDITLATSYTAAFSLQVPGNTSAMPSQSPNTPVNCRAKEGTVFVQSVSGEIHF
jgi:hypothetical protein